MLSGTARLPPLFSPLHLACCYSGDTSILLLQTQARDLKGVRLRPNESSGFGSCPCGLATKAGAVGRLEPPATKPASLAGLGFDGAGVPLNRGAFGLLDKGARIREEENK